ncbi:GNAT family N-acetyltransferase [Micromonospora sp. WMMD1128]|uniref:GNAT family N-acetyltransferase n=1 Tax=Micromonospora sp. WMMD1128 TaxID=3015150 RepID=UPI00248AC361|nr:GNAT family N-acetyltransferase [Micromonospora sp. WMMD1128]WBB71727.1 GNAT family N-acetyltransferase [Micromonospora sp. WMMD1128]
MNLEIWNAHDPADAARWARVHERWRRREVVAHPAYVRLFGDPAGAPMAAYARTSAGFVLYPFVLRPVDAPHLREAGAGWQDIASPYAASSGGPFQEGVSEAEAKDFWAAFDEWCRSRRVVTEFARLHVFGDRILPYPGQVRPRLPNVLRDLRVPADVRWREFEHKVRKNVNKARRSGVVVEADPTGARLDDFLAVYSATMDRRGAEETYHFSRAFLEAVIRELTGQFVFFHALHEGRVVSSELALLSADHIWSFLGGTDERAFALRPNDLLKVEMFDWAERHGRIGCLLGGGYRPDDGIFRYKRSFAPDTLLTYCTGSRVLNEPAYDALTAAHHREGVRRDPGWQPDPTFFPAYRAPLPD